MLPDCPLIRGSDMKMGDRVRFHSDTEVIDGLRKLGSELSTAASICAVRGNDDYLGFALRHLAAYGSKQLSRMASQYKEPIETHAWCARNLFELALLCEYVVGDPLRA